MGRCSGVEAEEVRSRTGTGSVEPASLWTADPMQYGSDSEAEDDLSGTETGGLMFLWAAELIDGASADDASEDGTSTKGSCVTKSACCEPLPFRDCVVREVKPHFRKLGSGWSGGRGPRRGGCEKTNVGCKEGTVPRGGGCGTSAALPPSVCGRSSISKIISCPPFSVLRSACGRPSVSKSTSWSPFRVLESACG